MGPIKPTRTLWGWSWVTYLLRKRVGGQQNEWNKCWSWFVWLCVIDTSGRDHENRMLGSSFRWLICTTPKSDHITAIVLHTLHWLSVEQRLEYKLLLLAFKSLNNEVHYICLTAYIHSRQFRSLSDSCLLRIPLLRLKFFGQRKFSY